jgi:hypothetical protein
MINAIVQLQWLWITVIAWSLNITLEIQLDAVILKYNSILSLKFIFKILFLIKFHDEHTAVHVITRINVLLV